MAVTPTDAGQHDPGTDCASLVQSRSQAEAVAGTDLGPRLLVVAALAWLDEDTLVVQRRAPGAAHARELELPGGKVERGEAPTAALRRELVEEWGPRAATLDVVGICDVLHHVYPSDGRRGPGPEVVLLVYHVDARAFAPDALAMIQPAAGVEIVQCAVASLPVAEFVAADRAFMASVREGQIRPPLFA